MTYRLIFEWKIELEIYGYLKKHSKLLIVITLR